jgi:hypothetical protein
VICSVWTEAARSGNCAGRVRRAITTSSRLALPARSPMPLMVTSTWRAPAWTAASVFAVASPRSLWQWTLIVASRPTRSTTRPRAPRTRWDRVADGVRMLTVEAPASTTASYTPSRNSSSVRDASSAENSISASGPRVWRAQPTQRRASASASSRVIRSLCTRWMSLVAMKRWRCGFSAGMRASMPRWGSPSRQRASPATAMPFVSVAMRCTASKSPGDAAGKPASMTSTLRRASWRATSSFSAAVRPAPGACSPSRSVVSKIRTEPAATPPPNRGCVASKVIGIPPRPVPRWPRPGPVRRPRRPA